MRSPAISRVVTTKSEKVTMKLEDYFTFLSLEDIRLKGTRVGIETILYEYIYHRRTAEAIADIYTNLTLEQIYATILYFLHNKEDITQYIANWLNYCCESEKEQIENPPEYILRLKKLKVEREKIA
jgi:uncharacterized protein (DUF433 family)